MYHLFENIREHYWADFQEKKPGFKWNISKKNQTKNHWNFWLNLWKNHIKRAQEMFLTSPYNAKRIIKRNFTWNVSVDGWRSIQNK